VPRVISLPSSSGSARISFSAVDVHQLGDSGPPASVFAASQPFCVRRKKRATARHAPRHRRSHAKMSISAEFPMSNAAAPISLGARRPLRLIQFCAGEPVQMIFFPAAP
jgi:hypothetical protein